MAKPGGSRRRPLRFHARLGNQGESSFQSQMHGVDSCVYTVFRDILNSRIVWEKRKKKKKKKGGGISQQF